MTIYTAFFHCSSVGMATSTNFEPIRTKGGYLSTNQLSVFRWYRFRSYLIDQGPIMIQIISKDLLYCLSKNVIYIQLTGDKESVFDKKYLCIENYNIMNLSNVLA